MNATIKIYAPDGTEQLEVLITPKAVHEEELMKSNFIRLSWEDVSKTSLLAGSYIVVDDVTYRLLEPYEPQQKSESRFSYEPQFDHPVMWLSKIPMYHLTGDVSSWSSATKNLDWVFTGPASSLMASIVTYINLWGVNEDDDFGEIFGTDWAAVISQDIQDKIISLQFHSNDVLSVCNQVAQQCECEYNFDFEQKKLRFGKVSNDSLYPPASLKVGYNIGLASVSATKEKYYNRYIVRGGTKNVTQPIEGGFQRSTQRLTLNLLEYPDSIIDLRDSQDIPMLTGELIFDDIYPKVQLYVYGVRERRCYREAEGGGYTDEQYSKWYVRLAYRTEHQQPGVEPIKVETGETTYYWYDYLATDEKRIPDTDLEISFLPNVDGQSVPQPLTGRTFGLVFFEDDTHEGTAEENVSGEPFPVYAGDYRIEFVEENGVIIPTTEEQSLYPRTIQDNTPSVQNNLITLIGIIVTNELKLSAQTELKTTALSEIERKSRDLNSYTAKAYSDVFKQNETQLRLGQSVVFNDGQDLNGGTSYELQTYVRKLTTRLDNPYIVEITIGNQKQKGAITSLQEKVDSIISTGIITNGDGSISEGQIIRLIQTYGRANFISKLYDDIASGRITFQQGVNIVGSAVLSGAISSNDFVSSFAGWQIDNLGNAEFESVRIRSVLEVLELLINRQQAQEGDTLFTDNDQIVAIDKQISPIDQSVSYVLTLKEKWDGYFTAQKYGNIIKGVINTLAAQEAGIYEDSWALMPYDPTVNPFAAGYCEREMQSAGYVYVRTEDTEMSYGKSYYALPHQQVDDGGNSYYTSWMQVVATHTTAPDNLEKNQIRVVLYGDNAVPAQKNFEPCVNMNIARWGCWQDPNEQGISEAEKKSRTQRQQTFYISVSDGRIMKLTGVDKPILEEYNYGTTLGELPDFVKNWSRVAPELLPDRDYLYAQGIVVSQLIEVDIHGKPEIKYVDCGAWVDGSSTGTVVIPVYNPTTGQDVDTPFPLPIPTSELSNPNSPYIGYGIYLCNEYNANAGKYQTHDVWHNGQKWRCKQHQPVVSGGTATYYEPKWNSNYWQLIEGDDSYAMDFSSSNGYRFYRGYVNTNVTAYVYFGDTDISADIDAQYWNWTRESEDGSSAATDPFWNAQHQGMRTIHLSDVDMPNGWSRSNRIIFTCTCTINDGKSTRIVENRIMA